MFGNTKGVKEEENEVTVYQIYSATNGQRIIISGEGGNTRLTGRTAREKERSASSKDSSRCWLVDRSLSPPGTDEKWKKGRWENERPGGLDEKDEEKRPMSQNGVRSEWSREEKGGRSVFASLGRVENRWFMVLGSW